MRPGKPKSRRRLYLVGVILLSLVLLPAFRPHNGTTCVNAGADPRIDPFGAICWLQQRYSYKSDSEPHLREHGAWAWGTHPFYFVYNWKHADGSAFLFRVGWRYDRDWRGYIGPTIALKPVPRPLLYY